jgi:hypothetical protein
MPFPHRTFEQTLPMLLLVAFLVPLTKSIDFSARTLNAS